jgi:two-component sensor histidine kinase/PAS domain-containing protein
LKKAERQLKHNREDLLEAQSIARIGNFELDFSKQTFTSSTVFDQILEIGNAQQKRFELFKEVVPGGDFPSLTTIFNKVFSEKKSLEYVGAFKTLKSHRTVWLQCLGRIVSENGIAIKMVGTIQDVTKNKTAEIEIQKLSDRLKLAMEGANIGVWEADLVSGKLHWEATMYDLFQVEPPIQMEKLNELVGNVHLDDKTVVEKIKADLAKGIELIDYDFRIILPEGTRHLRAITRQIKAPSGKAYRMVGVVIDISRDRELLKRLEQSLSDKDILIKEVHHRVKNNMQMISSILAIKALDLTDQDSKNIFEDCTVRIKSMAVVHDQLYRFYNVSEIDISGYLHHLLSGLNALMGGQSGNYVIEIESEEFKMDVDIALLCGLIVSELVANAFKHGFKGHSEGKIQVIFKNDGVKRRLLVTNTGNLMPEDVLEIKTTSLGMSLIRTFTTQLSGQVSKHPNNGILIEF